MALIPLVNALPSDNSGVFEFGIVSAKSIKTICVVMCAVAVAGLIASCFIECYELDQALVTDQGFAIGVKRADDENVEMVMKASDMYKSRLSARRN